MKKNLLILVLLTGAMQARHVFAQTDPAKLFDLSLEKFNRQYTVELERGNKMEILLTSMTDIAYISNIDSIVQVFTNDLFTIKDSLPPAGLSRRIDYNMDVPAIRKLRIRTTAPNAGYYAFINGAPAILKIQQDTIVIHGRIPEAWLRQGKRDKQQYSRKYYFCVVFCLNDFNDLAAYKDGRLNEKVRIIQQNYKTEWQYREDQRLQLKKYPEIVSNTPRGYIYRRQPFTLKKSIDVQNYKDRFIPSVSFTPTFIKTGDFIKREISVSVQAHFSFEKPGPGSVKTEVNLFTGIEYKVTPLIKSQRYVKIYPSISVAYLLQRRGIVYDRNTFRLSFGSFDLGSFNTQIQPAFYFHDFFRNITPSLRIVQSF